MFWFSSNLYVVTASTRSTHFVIEYVRKQVTQLRKILEAWEHSGQSGTIAKLVNNNWLRPHGTFWNTGGVSSNFLYTCKCRKSIRVRLHANLMEWLSWKYVSSSYHARKTAFQAPRGKFDQQEILELTSHTDPCSILSYSPNSESQQRRKLNFLAGFTPSYHSTSDDRNAALQSFFNDVNTTSSCALQFSLSEAVDGLFIAATLNISPVKVSINLNSGENKF